ncbi:hypothetical protein [Mucilaginibacter gossypii]|uniref:hypothetical protein n=1 Tax=Mucilaginibacter gossypii TaxID=551996 RepID=UPI00210A2667|nr:hypothetical protein [Mucilaginibacter gossypii]
MLSSRGQPATAASCSFPQIRKDAGDAGSMIGQVPDPYRRGLMDKVRVIAFQVLTDIIVQRYFFVDYGLRQQNPRKAFGHGTDLMKVISDGKQLFPARVSP